MIRYHVRRYIALVILHAFGHLKGGLEGLGFIDIDDSITADLIHCIRNDLADLFRSGRNGSDGLDVFRSLDFLRTLQQIFCNCLSCLIHTFAHQNRVGSLVYCLQTIGNHGLSQKSSSSRAVTCSLIGVICCFIDQLSTHVLELVFQFDFLCNGYPIIRDERGTIRLFQNNIASLRAKCDLDCISQLIHAIQHLLAGVFSVLNILCHILLSLSFFSDYFSTTARMSSAEISR